MLLYHKLGNANGQLYDLNYNRYDVLIKAIVNKKYYLFKNIKHFLEINQLIKIIKIAILRIDIPEGS